ncbi:hypothetical protein LCGC14_0110660 [marine sediment metagenome]
MLASYAASHPATARGIIAGLLAVLLGGIFSGWEALENAEINQTKARLQLESDALARLIEARFEDQATTLQRLADRWEYQRTRHEIWRGDVGNLLKDYNNFQAIEWVDRHYRMRWIEPLEGNEEVVGFTYHPTHPNFDLLVQSQEAGQPLLSSSFELQQGGSGLAYYVPLYRPGYDADYFDGFLLGIFRVEVLVADLLRNLPQQRLSLDFLDENTVVFSRHTADTLPDSWSVRSSVQLGNNHGFSIMAYPTRQLLASSTTALPLMVLITGALASLSLCYALWLALISAQRLEALGSSNRALQSEFIRRQAIETSLQHNQARLKLILDMTDHSHDALFIIGLAPLELTYLNRTCWSELGYTEEELRNITAISPSDIMPEAATWTVALKQLAEQKSSTIFQQQARTRSGELIPLEISVKHLQRHGRDYLICVGRNNSEQLRVAARLEQLSHQDGLTGLFNRRYFDHTLTSEWRRLRRQELPLGLLMVDADHFKAYNDTLGHQAGDMALQMLADALSDCLLREGDCACRYGGEEFAVILPGADLNQCLQVAQRLHEAVAEMNISHPAAAAGRLTISIGAATIIPAAEWSPADLLKMADSALYQAKAQGRDRTSTDSHQFSSQV